jgi:peptidoglycan/LPS O-acetylase OafA/YrhL
VLWIGGAALAVAVPLSWTTLFAFQIVLFPAIAVGVCLCITLCDVHAKGFTSAPTRWIGRFGFHAYFIYLFHYFIIEGLQMVLPQTLGAPGPVVLSLITLVLVTPLAVLSWRLFEVPLIRYGRGLERRPGGPGASLAGKHPSPGA